MIDSKFFCLTLDLENDWYFDSPGYDHLTLDYIDNFIRLIQELNVPITTFVVGKTLEKHPEVVQRLTEELDAEFHLHSYQHDMSKNYNFRKELRRGKRAFKNQFGFEPWGYRAPQGNIEPEELRTLESEGFRFDSSVFPSYRPGKYNHLSEPMEPYYPNEDGSLLEIPIGAFPGIRIPTGHSYFKLLGAPLNWFLSYSPLPKVLVYNVHLHDLYRTASHDNLSPHRQFIFKRNIDESVNILKNNVSKILERDYQPTKISTIYERADYK